MICFRRYFFVFLVVSGCAEDRAPDATTSPEITPCIRVDQTFDRTTGAAISVRFITSHPLHPQPFPLDRSDFPADFRPYVHVTWLAGELPVGARDIAFCPDCVADGWMFATVPATDMPVGTTALRCEVVTRGAGSAYDFRGATVQIPVAHDTDTKSMPARPNLKP